MPLDAETIVLVAYGRLIPRGAARAPSLAERPPVAAAALARRGAGRAGDHGRRRGDRRDLIQLVEELDAGPIAAQQAVPDRAEDDAGAVYDRAAEVGVELLERGAARAVVHAAARRGRHLRGEDRAATTASSTSRGPEEAVDRVRALSPHIGARAELDGRPVTVWRARASRTARFVPLEVQPAGRPAR